MKDYWGGNNRIYYHISKTKLLKVLKPSGFYERTDTSGGLKFWYPLANCAPIFPTSNVKESCFATTIEGAMFGYFSGGSGKAGNYYVYATNERPDVDLSDEMVMDFGAIEEVRYRKPVSVSLLCSIHISKKIIDRIGSCQVETEFGDVFFDDESAYKIKREIRRWLEQKTSCYR